MKKIISVFLFTVLITSCAQTIFVCEYDRPDFGSAKEILNYIGSEFTYCYDWNSSVPSLNNWQAPQVTQQIKSGDCDDFTIYFMQNYYEISGIKITMELVRFESGMLHYWAVYGNTVYDATNGVVLEREWIEERYVYTVVDIYPYDLVFPNL